MSVYLIWVIVSLYCLNRIIGWWIVVVSRNWQWYGTIVVIITAATLIGLPMLPQMRISGLWRILGIPVGIVVFGVGMVIGIRAGNEFDKVGTREDRLPTQLVTTGMYNVLRHPQYVALDVCFVGWSLVWGAMVCLYLAPLIIFLNWLQAFLEEKYILEKLFGDEFRAYKKRVGMFLPRNPKENEEQIGDTTPPG